MVQPTQSPNLNNLPGELVLKDEAGHIATDLICSCRKLTDNYSWHSYSAVHHHVTAVND